MDATPLLRHRHGSPRIPSQHPGDPAFPSCHSAATLHPVESLLEFRQSCQSYSVLRRTATECFPRQHEKQFCFHARLFHYRENLPDNCSKIRIRPDRKIADIRPDSDPDPDIVPSLIKNYQKVASASDRTAFYLLMTFYIMRDTRPGNSKNKA